MNLPDEDGLAFISRLKETTTCSVIARAEQTDGHLYRQAFDAGADDVVGGPASGREFLSRVQTQFAEATLREVAHERVRRQYHDLFMQAPVGIALMEGPDKVFTLSNPAYDEIVGHRSLIGLPLREAFPEGDLQPFFDRLDEVFETGEPFFAREVPADTRFVDVTSADQQPHLTFSYLPYRDADGTIRGVAVFVNDVTEQVAMRRAVERESERKDIFLAMLGHELRNPLAPIAHACELLRLKADDLDAELLEWITDTIDRQVGQLSHHVDELLDLARIQQGRLTIERERVSLEQLVTGAVEAGSAEIESRAQQLSVSVADRPVAVDVDIAAINQVVTNLLNNASKHTPADGHIWLDVELREGAEQCWLVLQVRDDGEGIDPDVLPDIFQPFTQANVTIDRAHGGLGLGLALVRGIVEMHGGSVIAYSEGRGLGSRFVVEIPVNVSSVDDETDDAAASDTLEDTRVLIVDDNDDVSSVLALQLKIHGATVYTAATGSEALEVAGDKAPTHVLLDIGLPDIDGYEVARRLHKLPGGGDVRIAAMTGYGQPEDVERSRQAGFHHHLTKPADPADILGFLSEDVAERAG